MLKDLGTACHKECLQVHYAKTKAVVFGKCPWKHKWPLASQVIKEVRYFHYLGVQFGDKGHWSHHLDVSPLKDPRSVQAVLCFSRTKGGNIFTTALRVLYI